MESFNHFGNIADALPHVLGQVVRKTAFDCAGNIQGFIRSNGQVDTGFMLNSVYTVTDEGSTYAGGADALPEVSGADLTTAYVAVAFRITVRATCQGALSLSQGLRRHDQSLRRL